MNTRTALAALISIASIAGGCGYMGSATRLDPAQFDLDTGWIAVRNVKFQPQIKDNDCGAASLAMVLTYWGHSSTPELVAAACPLAEEGSKAGPLRDLVRSRGLKGFLVHGTLEDLVTEVTARRPVIVGLVKPYVTETLTHYEVVVAINPAKKLVATLDPARGPRQNTYAGFLQEWEPAGTLALIVIGDDSRHGLAPRPDTTPIPLPPLEPGPGPHGKALSPSGPGRPASPRNETKSAVLYREEEGRLPQEGSGGRLHD